MCAIAEPIRTVIDRVKSAVQDDPPSRLDVAINDVTRLQGELQRIGAEVAGRKFQLLGKCAANLPPLSVASSVMSADPQESWREFVRQHPEWRAALKEACQLRLGIAELAHNAAERRTRAELSDESFSESEIQSHPRLRRAARRKVLWTGLTSQCEKEKDGAALWVRVTRKLL